MFRKPSTIFLIAAILSACNLPAQATNKIPATQTNTSIQTAKPEAVTPSLTGKAGVTILSPQDGATFPASMPIQVQFSASGGPFIEADLSVDGNPVASTTSIGPDTQVSGTLQWDNPIAGSHILRVMLLDSNKNITSAEVQVQVGGEAATAGTTPQANSVSTGAMQIRFVNLTDGGTVAGTIDKDGKPLVLIQVEISGAAPLIVTMSANDMLVQGEAKNPDGVVPFNAELNWHPLNGGGAYTIVVTAMTDDKQFVQASAHVTVTGVPVFTATPPPLDQMAVQRRFTELYRQLYSINIPAPSMQRFDFPKYPNFSRWISSIYYRGQRYYIELYDDTHYELNQLPYGDPSHPNQSSGFVICRPAGDYKILVVFVDYGNLGVKKEDVLAQVPPIADWTNKLYDDYAKSQGFAASPLHIKADATYISTPPAPGAMLTSAQILSATRIDPAKYDFVMEIDLDKENIVNRVSLNGSMEQGGGLAFGGCGINNKSDINIWSVQMDARETQGVLSMDFNHELSHLFGMLDNWPFSAGSIISPDGSLHDDWITYAMFGWSDSDGDGVPEIIDPTPYGTNGP